MGSIGTYFNTACRSGSLGNGVRAARLLYNIDVGLLKTSTFLEKILRDTMRDAPFETEAALPLTHPFPGEYYLMASMAYIKHIGDRDLPEYLRWCIREHGVLPDELPNHVMLVQSADKKKPILTLLNEKRWQRENAANDLSPENP